MKKSLLALILSLAMITQLSIPALAMSSDADLYVTDEKYSNVLISPEAKDIPRDIIEKLVSESEDDCLITIYNYVEAEPAPTPFGAMFLPLTQTVTEEDVIADDHFIISVAKGAKKTLTKEFKASLSASCSLPIAKTALDLAGKIEVRHTTTEEFSGPPENSYYNSRSYYVEMHEERGTFTGHIHYFSSDPAVVSGTWSSPTYYYEYSRDVRI